MIVRHRYVQIERLILNISCVIKLLTTNDLSSIQLQYEQVKIIVNMAKIAGRDRYQVTTISTNKDTIFKDYSIVQTQVIVTS